MKLDQKILKVLEEAKKFKGRRWICKKLGLPFSPDWRDPVYSAICKLQEQGKLEFALNMGYAVVSDEVRTNSSSDKRNSKLFQAAKKRYGKRVMGV